MSKFIYVFISLFVMILINSCGLTNTREAQVHDFLQQKVTSESQGALKLDNFKKINGYDQNIAGMKRYIIEWQADISTQQEIWKGGNFLVGYWSDFRVMAKQPSSMDELMMASSSKHFNTGTKIRLTGNSYLQKTEQGWRVEDLNVKTSQTLSEGSATNNSSPGTNSTKSTSPQKNQQTTQPKQPIYQGGTTSTIQTTVSGMYPQASERYLASRDVVNLNKFQLKIMRNEIFARHGYIFKTPDMKSYFSQQSWYHGQYNDVNSMLSAIEKQNIELIRKYE